MCGINGIVLFEESVKKNKLVEMNKLIRHRGPDAEGFFVQKNVGLSHVRLSIIDLDQGNQPMNDFDNELVIIYNGELYNYLELKNTLIKKGHEFLNNSDTEVILNSYKEWGQDCLSKFNGMYSFAIFNKKNSSLFLARDPLGMKPLYYYFDSEKFIFSSEIKALVRSSLIKPELQPESLIDYLTFQVIPDDKTFFKGIKKLLPGHKIFLENNNFSIDKFWDVNFEDKKFSDDDLLKKFAKELDLSVERHLMRDVPLGSYLSGGFDSSSVAFLASKKIKNLPVFTGFFNDGEKYSELECAEEVANKSSMNHHSLLIKSKDYLDNIRKITYHLDEPTIGTGAFPQFMMSKLASEHVKVVLTGHGGDELFAGYEVFKAAYLKESLLKNPVRAFSILKSLKISEIPRVGYFTFYKYIQPEVSYGLAVPFSYKDQEKLLTDKFLKLVEDYDPSETLENVVGKTKGANFIQEVYMKTYLPTLFLQEDKLGMAHSIESRMPICDMNILNMSMKISFANKLFGGELKHLVKASMNSSLPDILYNQPKKGFPTPFSLWFRKSLMTYAKNVLLSKKTLSRGIFSKKYIKELLNNHFNSKSDGLYDYVNAYKIYALISVELWFRIFIDGEKV